MFPYNSKVWTTRWSACQKGWIAERVSVVDFKRLLENVLYEKDDVAWGPNNKFRFLRCTAAREKSTAAWHAVFQTRCVPGSSSPRSIRRNAKFHLLTAPATITTC